MKRKNVLENVTEGLFGINFALSCFPSALFLEAFDVQPRTSVISVLLVDMCKKKRKYYLA